MAALCEYSDLDYESALHEESAAVSLEDTQTLEPETNEDILQESYYATNYTWDQTDGQAAPVTQEPGEVQSAPRRQRGPRRRNRTNRAQGQYGQGQFQTTPLTTIASTVGQSFFTLARQVPSCGPQMIAARLREVLLHNGAMGPDELYGSCIFMREICLELMQGRDVARYASY
jgi:hypothetical protein